MRSQTIAVVAILIAAGVTLQAQLRSRVQISGVPAPVAFVPDPSDRRIQLVVKQDGHVRVAREGVLLSGDFLDVSASTLASGEQGLLGLAFAPNTSSGRVFVNFTNRQGDTVVARFRRATDPLTTDAASRFDLRWGGAAGPAFIAQPFS